MRAYVLVTTGAAETAGAAQALPGLSGVRDTVLIDRGPYDIVCTVEGADRESIYQTVMNGILGLQGVKRVYTCVVKES